jgi:hypothetical protein
VRFGLLLVFVFAGAPAPAFAVRPVEVIVGPVRVRAYTMLVTAFPAQARSTATVLVELDRSAGSPVRGLPGVFEFAQSHTFLVEHGARVAISSTLSSAHVRVSLGRYGRIDLLVTNGRAKHSHTCLHEVHAGEARGLLRLAPEGRYFGTITRRRLPTTVAIDSGCQTSGELRRLTARHVSLAAGPAANSAGERITVTLAHDLTVAITRRDRAVQAEDVITAIVPRAFALSAQSDLSSATFSAFGPFLFGAATYTATTAVKKGQTRGVLSGTLTAAFDSPGRLAITSPPLPAALSRS